MSEHKLNLIRLIDDGKKTIGVLLVDGQPFSWSLELPWRDNIQFVSCVPPGPYFLEPDENGKHKYFSLRNVPGRSDIELHPANYAHELNGCIALGDRVGIDLIYQSRDPLNRLASMIKEPTPFIIEERF